MNRCTPGQPLLTHTPTHRLTYRLHMLALPVAVALSLTCNIGMAQTGSFGNASASAMARMNTPLQRMFPPKARRAEMSVLNAHEITLNGNAVRLSPGSMIRSTSNALVVSGGLIGQTFVVNYTTDTMGQAHEIWILTASEAADKRAGSEGMATGNVSTGER